MKTDDEFMQELETLISQQHNFASNLSKCAKFKELKDWIISKTNAYLNDPWYTLGTRIFYLRHGFTELPVCANPACAKVLRLNFTVYAPREAFFQHHCCNRCTQFDPRVKDKIEKTTLQRHHCKRGNHSPEMYEKSKQTCLERYGVDTPLKAKAIRNKIKQTVHDRYGVDSIGASLEIREKIKRSCIEKFGVDCVFKAKDVCEKIRRTVYEKYGVAHVTESPEVQTKIKQTILERYGSTSYLGTSACRQKTREYCQQNFGVDAILQIDEVREKGKNTNLRKYGHKIAYAFGTDEFTQLISEKYGVDHVSKSPEIRKLQAHRYKYEGISFDSAPEIAFYVWLQDMNPILDIDFEYSPNVRFEYEFDGKRHFYMPDFRLGNCYVELKGDHFFDESGKMINPYRDKSWTDAQYADECAKYEAKHQCMIGNGIVILKGDDYKFFCDYVSKTYGKDFILNLKTDQDF